MAANDEFPRGWKQSVDVSGAVASITVPAATNRAHVLTSLIVKIVNASAAAADHTILLTTSDGLYTNTVIGRLHAAATGGVDEWSDTLDIATGPGSSLTVALNSGIANVTYTLVIGGFDI